MGIYLDNAATTMCAEDVRELIMHTMAEDYGNPSSLHLMGVDAEKYVRRAAEQIAATLKCKEKELIFTSGGTESNNMALTGTARANARSGKHIISTGIEHPSVKKVLAQLEQEGFRITLLPADSRGRTDLEALKEALDEDTILVSMMMVNNEIGTIQPVEEAAALIRERAPKALFHVDAIQAYGKLRIQPKKLGIDLLSVSGHKIHGPKGVGFLYVRSGVKIQPLLFGGGQQNGMRSGTINVPGIAGLGLAAENCYAHLQEHAETLYGLRSHMIAGLEQMEGVLINGSRDNTFSAPHIVNASFTGIRSEVMLHALEDKGIYVSSGSACASHHPSDRSTLMVMGCPKDITDSAIRFSFSFYTTQQEIDDTLAAVRELLPVLRRYVRH